MLLRFNDEIIEGIPKYNITDNIDGTKNIELANNIIKEGTPLNRATFDNLQGDLYTQDRYNVPEIAQSGNDYIMSLDIPLTLYEKGKIINIDGYARAVPITSYIYNFTYNGEKYVAVGGGGSIIYSIDSNIWYNAESPTTKDLQGVCYSEDLNLFVAVGFTGTIVTSSDAITWNLITSNTSANLFDVIYTNGKFVAVGGSGETATILTSSDGITWNSMENSLTRYLIRVIYANNQYVTVGYGGALGTSPDGINWTTQSSGTNSTLYDVIYENNKYIAVGYGGDAKVISSVDGITWVLEANPSGQYAFRSIVYQNNQYVLVCNNGYIYTTNDFTTFTPQNSGTTNHLFAIKYIEGTYIVVGSLGTILKSNNAEIWNRLISEASITNPYININNLGAKQINGTINYGEKYTLVYNGESWNIVSGKVVTGNFSSKNTLQTIDLGFTPDLVICYNIENNDKIVSGSTSSITAPRVPRILTKAYEDDINGRIINNGFTYNATKTLTVYYIAIKF